MSLDDINFTSHSSPSYDKWCLKANYDLTGDTAITTCTDCGKGPRLCQEYENQDGNHKVYICEQCTWGITDEQYDLWYKEE